MLGLDFYRSAVLLCLLRQENSCCSMKPKLVMECLTLELILPPFEAE